MGVISRLQAFDGGQDGCPVYHHPVALPSPIMTSSLRTLADGLVITAVAAMTLMYAETTGGPRWMWVLSQVPTAYLISRLSGDRSVQWWKMVGFVFLMCALMYNATREPGKQLFPHGWDLGIVMGVCYLVVKIERRFMWR